MIRERPPRGLNTGKKDLRARQRYPLHLNFSGEVLGEAPVSILGETINMSSQGILFAANEEIPNRAHVQLQINWPVRSDQGDPLRLAVFGTVMRSSGHLAAARIWRHAFVPTGASTGGAC